MGTITCPRLEREAKEITKLDGSSKCRTRPPPRPAEALPGGWGWGGRAVSRDPRERARVGRPTRREPLGDPHLLHGEAAALRPRRRSVPGPREPRPLHPRPAGRPLPALCPAGRPGPKKLQGGGAGGGERLPGAGGGAWGAEPGPEARVGAGNARAERGLREGPGRGRWGPGARTPERQREEGGGTGRREASPTHGGRGTGPG